MLREPLARRVVLAWTVLGALSARPPLLAPKGALQRGCTDPRNPKLTRTVRCREETFPEPIIIAARGVHLWRAGSRYVSQYVFFRYDTCSESGRDRGGHTHSYFSQVVFNSSVARYPSIHVTFLMSSCKGTSSNLIFEWPRTHFTQSSY
jgi:hypothetical protein